MMRKSLKTILSTASLVVLMAVGATSASAAPSAPQECASESAVIGDTTSVGGITYDADSGTCGVLGVRVQYTHVGGASWTSWKYNSYASGSVVREVRNGVQSMHSTSVSDLFFRTWR